MVLQILKSLHRRNGRSMRTRRIRPRHDPSIRLRKALPRPGRTHVLTASLGRRLFDRRPVPAPDRVKHTFLLLAFGREASDFLADDDGVVRDWVYDAREDRAAVADGTDDAAVAVDFAGYALELGGRGVIDQGSVAG